MSQLRGKEFIEEGFFDSYKKGLEEALKLTKDLKNELKEGIKSTQKDINIIKPDNVKNIEKFNSAVDKAGKEIEQLSKVERKELDLQKEIKKLKTNKTYQAQVKSVERLRQEKNAIARSTRDEIKAEREAGNEYKRLSRLLNDLRNKYKNVAASQGENSKSARDLLKQIKPLDKQLKKIDGNVGQFQRNVGKYTNAFKNLTSQLGIFVGVAGAFRLLKDSVGIVRNFEKQAATTAGVLGKTRDEITGLTEDAKKLGSTTEFTASQVGSLQEAYARLGFSQQQILQSTEATLRGATAFQSDLGETANLVGAALNQFGIDASDTQRVVDVLANSTQRSALNFRQLQTALPIVGKTAQVAGFSIEETASLLGVLSNNGIDASTSATALRNIFLENAKSGKGFNESLEEIANSTDKLATANELFGKRGAAVAVTLSENIDKIDELDKAFLNASGSAEKLAKEQLNTLDGSLKLLNSAWEGFILNLNDATNGGNILTKSIKFLADNLDTILKVVGSLAGSFIAYKTTQLVINTATSAYNNVLKVTIFLQKSFNTLLKSNPIGIVLTAFTSFVAVLGLMNTRIGKSTSQLTELKKQSFDTKDATDELTDAISDEVGKMNSLFEILKDTNTSSEQRRIAIEEINTQYNDYLPNLLTEQSSLEDIATAQDLANKALIKNIVLKQKEKAISEATSIQIKNQQEALVEFNKAVEKVGGNVAIANQVLKEQIEILKDTEQKDYLGKLGNDYGLYTITAEMASEQNDLFAEAARRAGVSTHELEKAVIASYSAHQDQQNTMVDINNLYETYLDIFADVEETTKKNTDFNKKNADSNRERAESLNDLADAHEDIDLQTFNEETKEGAKENEEFWDNLRKDNLEKEEQYIKEDIRKRKEYLEKRIEQRKALYQNLNTVADAFARREAERSQQRLEEIDEEIQASQQRANTLREIAEKGNLNAKQSLAVEQKREAEAQRKREQEIKKQKQIEASLALLKTYTGALEQGATTQQAITEVLKNGTLLAGLINSLPSFYEGTENTTKGNLDNKGGFLSVLHPNERVVPAKYNKFLDGIPNDKLPDLAKLQKNVVINGWQSGEEILNKFDSLEKAVKGLQSTQISYDFNNIENIITKVIKKDTNTKRYHKKRSSIW